MADVDNLSIKISSDAQSALNSLKTLTNALKGVGEQMTAISKNTLKINFAITGDAQKEINQLTTYSEKAAKEISKSFASVFQIDKSQLKTLNDAVSEFTKITSLRATGDKTQDAVGASERLVNVLKQVSYTAKDATSDYTRFAEVVKSIDHIKISTSDIPSSDFWNFQNLAPELRGRLNTEVGTTLDSLFQEWKEQFAGIFSGIDASSVEDELVAVNNALKESRVNIEALNGAKLDDSTWSAVIEAQNQIVAKTKEIVNAEKTLSDVGIDIGTQSTGFTELANGIKKIGGVDAGNLISVGSAIKGLASGIHALDGISANVAPLTAVSTAIKPLSDPALASSLTGLSTALQGMNVGNLSGLATGITQLGAAMTQLNETGVKKTDFNRLVKELQLVGTIDGSQLTATAQGIQKLGEAFRDLSGMDETAKNITELANALSSFGKKTATTAIANIPLLASSFKNLMATLSTAPTVSQNIIDMANALANLTTNGAKVGTTANSLSGYLKKYSTSATAAKKSSFSLASAIGKLYASYWLLFRAFSKIKDAIDISSDLTEVQNVVAGAFAEDQELMNEFASTSVDNFGISELTAKTIGSRFQAMGNAMGISNDQISKANEYASKATNGYVEMSDSMADVSINLTKLSADMASFYNLEADEVAEDLASIYTGMTTPLRKYGLDVTQATLKSWALSQGLDADVESMTQAEKTMLRYQYVMAHTTDAQNDYSRTADTWANQTKRLSQNLQELASVIGGVFINVLKPLVSWLNIVITKLTDFATVISNSLGKIFGWKYEDSAKGQTLEDYSTSVDDTADSLDNAADSAKKFKQQLRGIDELNNLTTSDSGSSGSSSGSGTSSSGASSVATGEWTKTEGFFESSLDTLQKLGNEIGTTIANTLRGINWDSVYESANGFGTGLAEFLNGLISPNLFGALGQTIAGALNTVLYALNSFGTTFDWNNFGDSIAAGVNEFFDTFDFANLANTIDAWVQGLWNALKDAIDGIEWDDVYDGLKDFLSNLDIKTIAIVIGVLTIKKILGLKLGQAALSIIGTSISRAIGKSIATKLGVEIGAEGGIGAALSAGLTKAFSGIGTFAGGVLKFTLTAALSIVVAKVSFEFGKEIGKLLTGDTETYENFTWFGDEGFFDSITEDFGVTISALSDMMSDFSNNPVIATLANVLLAPFSPAIDAMNFFVNDFGEFKNNVSTTASLLSTNLSTTWTLISSTLSAGWTNLKNNASTALSYLQTTISTKLSGIKQFISQWWTLISSTLSAGWTNLKNNASTALSYLQTTISTKLSGIKQSISQWWNNISTFFSSKNWNFSGIKSGLSTAFNAAISAVKQVWNNFATWLNSKLTFKWDAVKIGGKTIIDAGSIDLGKIPTFEAGGYPQSASLFMAGENGMTEMVGTIGGKTAVASNGEITGISDAVYSTSQQEIVLLRQQNQLLQALLQKEINISTSDVGKAARSYAKEYFARTGNGAYSF